MDMADRDAEFTEFVLARFRGLLGTAYLLSGDHARAEDLLQTALLKTYLAWPRLREPRAVEAYVRRTMVTTSISWARRRWRGEIPTEQVPDHPQPAAGDGIDGIDELWPQLRLLPARQRAVLVLRYYEDLSEAQVADLLGCSVSSVKSLNHRALTALRGRLASERPDGSAAADAPHLTNGGGP